MLVPISGRMKHFTPSATLQDHSLSLCTQDITTHSTRFVRLTSLQQESKTEWINPELLFHLYLFIIGAQITCGIRLRCSTF
jgi:hypothetical protein